MHDDLLLVGHEDGQTDVWRVQLDVLGDHVGAVLDFLQLGQVDLGEVLLELLVEILPLLHYLVGNCLQLVFVRFDLVSRLGQVIFTGEC